MAANARQNFLPAHNALADTFADAGVLANERQFFLGQGAWFIKNRFRHADFADVMQARGQAKLLKRGALQVERPAQAQHVAANAMGVAGCVRVTLLHRQDETIDRGEERVANAMRLPANGAFQVPAIAFVFSFEEIAAAGDLEHVVKFIEIDRLDEVMMSAGLETGPGGVSVLTGRDDDNCDVGPATADLLHQPNAALARHAQGGHDDPAEALL